MSMFGLLGRYLGDRDYYAAVDVLDRLGDLLVPVNWKSKGRFHNARVQVVPLEECLHVFLVFDDEEQFDALPGDLVECTNRPPVRLRSKGVQLAELGELSYGCGVLLHFMHVEEIGGQMQGIGGELLEEKRVYSGGEYRRAE